MRSSAVQRVNNEDASTVRLCKVNSLKQNNLSYKRVRMMVKLQVLNFKSLLPEIPVYIKTFRDCSQHATNGSGLHFLCKTPDSPG